MMSIERRVYLQREVHTDGKGRRKVVGRLVVAPEPTPRPAVEARKG
jgi:hypothetical protein